MTIDPVALSKLNLSQVREISRLRVNRSEVDVKLLVDLIADSIFLGNRLSVETLVRAVEAIGPFEVDKGKGIWHYSKGVWEPDGAEELTRRIVFCTGHKYRKDFVTQAESIIKSRRPKIGGLGPREYMNVKNGMLNWKTLELVPHSPNFYSTYQLKVSWVPSAVCPTIDTWMEETFDSGLHKLLYEIVGVTWFPGMGFQKAVVLLGSGFNGKGTFLRLCKAALPSSAITAIDPKILATNRFMSAELFGKTANICGDIERFTFGMTAEFKKITGDDPLIAERKNGQPFTFISEATNLFAANKMPPSKDNSYGWYRRWLIVPLERRITGQSDPTLESRLHAELEGLLVRAVRGLQEVMENGGFSEPEVCKKALQDYEFSCNSSALFVNERIEFSPAFKATVGNSQLIDTYKAFCLERKLEIDSKNEFYEMLEALGEGVVQEKWIPKSSGSPERGYIGMMFRASTRMAL